MVSLKIALFKENKSKLNEFIPQYPIHTGPSNTDQHRIYTVSELTSNIKGILEKTYPFVWICGEISNFNIPASGHFYFTVKDEHAQINAVMFRNQNR